jgi:hypothetical protein
MELSELTEDGVEISRFRIPAPGDDNSYCEKNWMPVVDMPYNFVKWSNNNEVFKFDPVNRTCEQVYVGPSYQRPHDYRGGSHVIPIGEYRVCLTHTTHLYKSEQGKKNAIYRHCFIVWDKDWNIIKYGDPFSFMDSKIEFCAGMTEYNGDILITFGVQDNAAYVLKAPMKFIVDYING